MKSFKCERCGECCRSPRLYKQDIERIKNLGYKEEEFIYIDNFGNNYLRDKKGWCMFLKKGKTSSCIIYESRPKICRLYPAGFLGFVSGDCKPRELAFDRYLERRNRK